MKKSVKYGLYFVVGLVAVLLLASIVYFLLLFPAFDGITPMPCICAYLLPVENLTGGVVKRIIDK